MLIRVYNLQDDNRRLHSLTIGGLIKVLHRHVRRCNQSSDYLSHMNNSLPIIN